MRRRCLAWFVLLLAIGWARGDIVCGPDGRAEEFDQGPVFSLIEENDLIVDTDRDYTQGIKLTYLYQDGWVPGWLAWTTNSALSLGYDDHVAKFGYDIGQNIYTPGDTDARELLKNDRPYAGWLYAGLILQKRGYTAGRYLTLESFQLDLGIIGPESLGENAQNWIHELRGFSVARGWDNQLDTEPGLALRYQRSLSLPLIKRGEVADVIPHVGTSLGNVETSFRLGFMTRLGTRLPRDFGPQTINALTTTSGGRSRSNPGPKVRFYVFAALEGSAVLYSAFLDGNLWNDSHSVNREMWAGELRTGFAVVFRFAELGFAYVERTRDFEEETRNHSYGSVFLKAKF